MTPRRLRFAHPFSVLLEQDKVWLVAGEDYRYAIRGPAVEQWLPGLLADLEAGRDVDALLDGMTVERRAEAARLLERLYGERVLVEVTAAERHIGRDWRIALEGSGAVFEALARTWPIDHAMTGDRVSVLCQDRLDYAETLAFDRACRTAARPALWVTTGPMQRGYVSPLILPDAGPCLHCLILHFQRLSPVSELYRGLMDPARPAEQLRPAPFPATATALLADVVRAKLALLSQPVAAAALYRLHVLEVAVLEVSSHPLLRDPECPHCTGGSP